MEHRDIAAFSTYLYIGDIVCHSYGYLRYVAPGHEAEIRRHDG